jgi:uncharacterized membrane protein
MTKTQKAEVTVEAEETSMGLDENVAGALTYLLGFVTGILFYLLEDENEFVRFHAVQSTIVFVGYFVLSFVISAVTFGLGALLVAPIGLGLWLFLMYKAYSGEEYEFPVVGGITRDYV